MYDATNRSAIDRVATAIGRQCGTIAACGFRLRRSSSSSVRRARARAPGRPTTFAAGEVVSSDRLRAVVGEAEDDLAASRRRVRAARRDRRRPAAARPDGRGRHARPRRRAPPGVGRGRARGTACRRSRSPSTRPPRRAARGTATAPRPVPAAVRGGPVRTSWAARQELAGEGFAAVHGVAPVRVVPRRLRRRRSPRRAERATAAPVRAQRLALRLARRRRGDARATSGRSAATPRRPASSRSG